MVQKGYAGQKSGETCSALAIGRVNKEFSRTVEEAAKSLCQGENRSKFCGYFKGQKMASC